MPGGVQFVSMRDDWHIVETANGTDLLQLAGAATPFRIRLHDPDGIIAEEAVDLPTAVEMLARGNGYTGGLAQPLARRRR
jgi:hypothetical protein